MSKEAAVLDYRSDTITRPTAAMRKAMAEALVGDDVFREDPTVNRLEEDVAGRFGREASLFVPSGTMANLLGLAVNCQRGDEVILERRTHSLVHEVGGATALFGILLNPQDSPDGILSAKQVEAAIRPDDIHEPVSRLVVVENTANMAGGRIVSLERLKELRRLTITRGLRLHMDGARIWNASVATGVKLSDYAAEVDTLICCLSKGLGCPVGSLLVGNGGDIERARKLRKMLGGGMRQAGVLAACGLYALEHNMARLAEDHAAAKELASGLGKILDGRFRVQEPETNILLVHTDGKATTDATVREWQQRGILTLAVSDTAIRLVTHLDLPKSAAAETIRRLGH